MIIARWTCEVPAEKREGLLRFMKEEMRGIYHAHGCQRHEILLPLAAGKRYFSFHDDLEPTMVVEELGFADRRTFETFLAAMDADPMAGRATARYETEFGVHDCTFTLLTLDA